MSALNSNKFVVTFLVILVKMAKENVVVLNSGRAAASRIHTSLACPLYFKDLKYKHLYEDDGIAFFFDI